jgi:NADH dehydrogenase FAD-containing subunit
MNLDADRPAPRHRVVIVGGGAGGLELATRLGDTLGRRRQADITLIDCKRTHVWKPKLHEIAAFARMMYLSLYKMHELALHGITKVSLDTLARLIVRRTEPHMKLH